MSFLRTASAKRAPPSAVMTKLPGPPVVNAAKAAAARRHPRKRSGRVIRDKQGILDALFPGDSDAELKDA